MTELSDWMQGSPHQSPWKECISSNRPRFTIGQPQLQVYCPAGSPRLLGHLLADQLLRPGDFDRFECRDTPGLLQDRQPDLRGKGLRNVQAAEVGVARGAKMVC